jgi:hypothetical protein
MTQSRAKPTAKSKSRASKPAKLATVPKLATKKSGHGKKPTKPVTNAKARAGVRQVTRKNSRQINQPILSPGGWHDETLAQIRHLIHEADPEIVEEIKWIKPTNPSGVPVWSHAGIVCTGESYKQVVKLTFARGASLADPNGLFNSSLEGNTRRAIDIREGEVLDTRAFKALVQAAVAENLHASTSKAMPNSNKKPTVATKPIAKRKRHAKSNPTAKAKPLTKTNPSDKKEHKLSRLRCASPAATLETSLPQGPTSQS